MNVYVYDCAKLSLEPVDSRSQIEDDDDDDVANGMKWKYKI